MRTIADRLAEIPIEKRTFYEWQFALSRRICQIMEADNLSQPEFAQRVGITEQELDDLIHMCADPSLSMLARISALSKSELMTWVNADLT